MPHNRHSQKHTHFVEAESRRVLGDVERMEEVFYVGGVEAVDNYLLGLICRAVLGQRLDGGYQEKSGNIATVVGSAPSQEPSSAARPMSERPRGWPFAGGCSYRVPEWVDWLSAPHGSEVAWSCSVRCSAPSNTDCELAPVLKLEVAHDGRLPTCGRRQEGG